MNRYKSIYKFYNLYLLLILFDLELSYLGFNNVFSRYSRKYSIKAKTKNQQLLQNQVEEIKFIFDMLDIVCTWYPRKADCIHKTFLGYKILRKKFSMPVDMVIGIRKFPFEAHAWLQCYNNNFFDNVDETNKYKIILTSADVKEGGHH